MRIDQTREQRHLVAEVEKRNLSRVEVGGSEGTDTSVVHDDRRGTNYLEAIEDAPGADGEGLPHPSSLSECLRRWLSGR